jgi:hypothetical protein
VPALKYKFKGAAPPAAVLVDEVITPGELAPPPLPPRRPGLGPRLLSALIPHLIRFVSPPHASFKGTVFRSFDNVYYFDYDGVFKYRFTILRAALQRAGMLDSVRDLNGALFAPTDAAFKGAGINETALARMPPSVLARLLRYHVARREGEVFPHCETHNATTDLILDSGAPGVVKVKCTVDVHTLKYGRYTISAEYIVTDTAGRGTYFRCVHRWVWACMCCGVSISSLSKLS